MPLDSNAPDYAGQTIGLMQNSPSYVAPDMSEFTDPAKVLANEHAGLENGALFADTSLRGAAFNLQQQQAQQQMKMNELLHPLLAAGTDAQTHYMTTAAQQQTDALTQLPDYSQRLNALDPADDQFGQKLSGIMGEASSNPALFANLQQAAQTAQTKRQSFQATAAGTALSGLQSDAASGVIPFDTYTKAKALYQEGAASGDFTGVFAASHQVNQQKAKAARGQFQTQLTALGDYAPSMSPKLSAGIYDPAEITQFTGDIAEAQKQKNQGTTYTNVATTKGDTAMAVQDAIQRFGTSPAAQTGQGKVLASAATTLGAQIKAATDPMQKAKLQGQLEMVTSQMESLGGVTAPTAGSAASSPDQETANTLTGGINYLQKQIDLGNSDLPSGAKIPGGIADPVEPSFKPIGSWGPTLGGNVPDGMTPNQFRLQHLQGQMQGLQARISGVASTPGAAPIAGAPPATSAAPSLTPDTDAVESGSTATPQISLPGLPSTAAPTSPGNPAQQATATRAVTKAGTRTPSPASIAKLKADPSTANQFDAFFGPGTSARYLAN